MSNSEFNAFCPHEQVILSISHLHQEYLGTDNHMEYKSIIYNLKLSQLRNM